MADWQSATGGSTHSRSDVHDLVVMGARLVATMDDERREVESGWVAVDAGLIAESVMVRRRRVIDSSTPPTASSPPG